MSFVLPDNWYPSTVASLMDGELPSMFGALHPANAWKYVVACVMWAETVK